MIQGLPVACVSVDLEFFKRSIPAIPTDLGNLAAISQAQPSFPQEGYL
jgi:hypothetical protein